jgi:hypothetical protein
VVHAGEPADQGDDRVDVAVDVEPGVPRLLQDQALEDGGAGTLPEFVPG